MAFRPRRGKQMPMIPPDLESDNSSISSDKSNRTTPEETEFVSGDLLEGEAAVAATVERLALDDDDNDNDEEEDPFRRPPPTPGVNLEKRREPRNPQDYGSKFHELIHQCHSLESGSGFGENFQADMSSNIKQAHKLFLSLLKGSTRSNSEFDENGARRRPAGPGDVVMAFKHTHICSTVMRRKAESIGTGASLFSVEAFLESLKKEYVDEDGDYSPADAVKVIGAQAAIASKSVTPFVAVVGTFERDAIAIPKAKKPRPTGRRKIPDEQHEGSALDDSANHNTQVPEKDPAEKVAKEINKILKYHYRQHANETVNLFEFVLDRNSFSRTIENLFYVTFLVKDGHVSLNTEETGKYKDVSLNIKPEKSHKHQADPAHETETRSQIHRQKHILSFSPRMWKSFCDMSQGENTIQMYQPLVNQ